MITSRRTSGPWRAKPRSPRFPAAAAVLSLVACSPTLPPPALHAAPAEAHDTDQSHLLLFPEANAESLLGRAVQKSADGSWTIADARAPGCEVVATREKAAFHTSRKIDAHSMTSLAGGYAKLVSLEVKFGRQNTADIDIDNAEILRADTRGACGELVVDKVFVGHGKRSISASAQAGGSADVHVGVVNAAPSVDTGQSQADAVAWADDQAYGFTVRENSKVEPLDVRVELPSILFEGDYVTAQVEAAQPAWLVVYAFADKRDFDAMKPAAGSENADGPAYAAELTKKLQGIPISRWSRAVVGYTIQPKAR